LVNRPGVVRRGVTRNVRDSSDENGDVYRQSGIFDPCVFIRIRRQPDIELKTALSMVRSDLLGEDVCVASVAGDLADHAQVDETEVYRADKTVVRGVVESIVGGNFI
jgi:hypothetical protein